MYDSSLCSLIARLKHACVSRKEFEVIIIMWSPQRKIANSSLIQSDKQMTDLTLLNFVYLEWNIYLLQSSLDEIVM